MSFEIVLSWIVCGLLVGIVMYLLVPGQRYFSMSKIIGLGVTGALVGGFLFSFFAGRGSEPFWLTSRNVYSWLFATLCAAFAVWIYPYALPGQWHGDDQPVGSGW